MEDKIEGCQALKHLYGITQESSVFNEVLGHLTAKTAEELYWAILVLKRDFNQSVSYIYKMKELLMFVEGCQGFTSMNKQLEVVSDICSNLVKFDYFKVLLFDEFYNAFYQCQEAHPTAKPMVAADDPLCLEINEAKSVLVAVSKNTPKFMPIVETILSNQIASYCIVPLFSSGKNLKGFIVLANKILPFEAPNKTDEALLLHLGPVILKSLKLAAGFERKNLHCDTLKIFSNVLMASAYNTDFHIQISSLREWCLSKLGADQMRVLMVAPSLAVTPLTLSRHLPSAVHTLTAPQTLFSSDHGLPDFLRIGESAELPAQELCGLANLSFYTRRLHLAQEGSAHPEHNELMDLVSPSPIITVPIFATATLAIGVFQVTGQLGGVQLGIEERLFDTLGQVASVLGFHCVQHMLKQHGYSEELLDKLKN